MSFQCWPDPSFSSRPHIVLQASHLCRQKT
jgi:hypothetical protein